MMSHEYTIRRAQTDDWQLLKDIRLEALQLEANKFGSTFEKESVYDEDKWKEFIGDGKSRAMFLLQYDENVIGLTGIVQTKENPEELAMIASYIRNEHRGKGLSKMLYEARLNWAKEQKYKSIIISHRESNIASKKANQKFGFTFTHTEEKQWVDGKWENNVFYRLDLE